VRIRRESETISAVAQLWHDITNRLVLESSKINAILEELENFSIQIIVEMNE
jgi:hypothetical protein